VFRGIGADQHPVATLVRGLQFHRPLGRGAFGSVWKARAQDGSFVAVKRMHWPFDHRNTQKELAGLKTIEQLDHPNILKVRECWVNDGLLYVASELADESFQDWLDQAEGGAGISLRCLIPYLHGVASGLDYLHAHGVVHRDIKEGNILKRDTRAFISDFGLARLMTQLQERGTVCGTPAYMSPEVWAGKLDNACDQYSLACTIVRLVAGHLPFHGEGALCLQHCRDVPDLSSFSMPVATVLLRGWPRSRPTASRPARRSSLRSSPRLNAPPSSRPSSATRTGRVHGNRP